MGKIVGAFREFVTRLESANVEGGKLEDVTLLEGPTNDVLERQSLPAVIYELTSAGSQTEKCLGGIAISEFSVLVSCHTRQENGYYTDAKTGILDLYEAILDVVDGGGTALNGNGHWIGHPAYRINSLERTDLDFVYQVEIIFSSSKYTRGELT